MANSFTCPSCGAPLDYHGVMTSVQCPYCFTSSQVPEELRNEPGTTVEPGVMLNFMANATSLRELAAAVKAKQTPKAIELYQKIYKVDAATAAQAVSQLTGGGQVLVSGYTPSPKPSPSPDPYTSSYTSAPSAPLDPAFPTTPTYTPPGSQDDLRTPLDPAFPTTPTYTASSYTPPGSSTQPPATIYPAGTATTTYTTKTRSGLRRGMLALVSAVLTLCAIFCVIGFFSAALGGDATPTADATQALVQTRIANASTEQSQVSTQVASTQAVPIEPATVAPPATEDPAIALTATAIVEAQATADANLITEAKQWPISFKEDFSKPSDAWLTRTNTENDYYTGSEAITDGVYRWDYTAKGNFESFISPDPYQSVTDFYASADVKVTGSEWAGAGLAFRDGVGNDGGYYVFVVSPNGSWHMNGYQGSTTIDYNGDMDPLPAGPNHMAVLGQGPHFILLVNDKVITTIDDSFFKAGDIGFAVTMQNAGDQATFDFDNLEIRTP